MSGGSWYFYNSRLSIRSCVTMVAKGNTGFGFHISVCSLAKEVEQLKGGGWRGVGDCWLGWEGGPGFILGWGRWSRIPSLQEASQRARACGCALGVSEQVRGITPQECLGCQLEGGGDSFGGEQNCGELFRQRLQEWLLKLRYS